MANIKIPSNNLKGRQVETGIYNMKLDSRHHEREPHGIQEGIRKDKKIKMNRKMS